MRTAIFGDRIGDLQETALNLDDRDYTLIIDKSSSMSTPDQLGGRTRWQEVEESTLALAHKCEQLDPDGITVYLFSGRFKRYDNVTSDRVSQIFRENEPMGTTNLTAVLQAALEDYFHRKSAGQTKPGGETILVITDGEPDDRQTVMQLIVNATHKIDRDEELAISFVQVGNDGQTKRFLRALDDQMQQVGARFDICDAITIDDMAEMTIAEVLLKAVID